MSRTTRSIGGPIVGIVVVALVFARLNAPFRAFEAGIATDLLKLAFPSLEAAAIKNSILLQPHNGPFIVATLIPSCSALASMLTVGCLAFVTPRGRYTRGRRVMAVATAVIVVAVGNMVRIVASLAAGVLAGRQGLILFHDAAGSFFSFASILVGYTLFLAILLPKRAGGAPQPEVIDRVAV